MSFSKLKACLLGLFMSASLVSPALAADPFSIVLLPDTQYYTVHSSYDIYDHQMIWIKNNKNTYNIKFVVHLGDMTNNNTASEWAIARNAYDILDTSGIAYSVLPGNHDYVGTGATKWHRVAFRDLTRFNNNFGPQKFASKPWYGGNLGETNDKNGNNYCFFEVGDLKFMILSLEYAPRKSTITWANDLIAQHPDRRVIIATHAYLKANGEYIGTASEGTGIIGASGSQLWDELISRHSNVFLATSGHVTDSEINTRSGVPGNTIYEMLVDYQAESPRDQASPNLGNGWLRVLTFNPDLNTVDAFTITVEAGNSNVFLGGVPELYHTSRYSANELHSDHLFSFNYDMSPLGDYYYLNASTEIQNFTVNSTGGGNQRDSDVKQDKDSNLAMVWEGDHDGNGVFDIRLRGFDADGNARFSERVVNSLGTNSLNAANPQIGMAADGRFAVAFQTSNTDVRVRTYNANGTPNGAEISVPTTAGGNKRAPDIAMAGNGDFVVVWEDDADGNGYYQVKARGFHFDKSQKFAQKTVNTVAAGQQVNPEVAMASNGDYVVVWQDDQNNDDLYEVGARGFASNEQQTFAQMFANSTQTGQQSNGDVAMADNGRFVAIWQDDNDGNGVYQIKARGFNANGSQAFSERTVNTLAGGNQTSAGVAIEPNGSNWYAVWQDDNFGEGNQMMTQIFNMSGTQLFANDIRANSAADVNNDGGNELRTDPVISVHKSGRYIVTWTDDSDGNGFSQIVATGLQGLSQSLVTKTNNGTVGRSVNEVLYKEGQNVILTASADQGYVFDRWIGDFPSGNQFTNPITVNLNVNKNLEARFVLENAAEVIVDNNTSDFTASSNWATGSFGSSYYGSDYQWRPTESISDAAYWNVDLPNSGTYDVYARWTAGGNRSTSAPYLIFHDDGTDTVHVNQQINDGTWVLLGTYDFTSGASNKVALSCWTAGGFVVVADAVKFVQQ